MSKPLPKQVQKQIDQTEALMAGTAAPLDAATPAPAPEPAVEAPAPVPAAPAFEAPVPAPAPVAPQVDTEDKWESKYKTLQGMFNRSSMETRAQLTRLEQENQTLRARVVEKPVAPTPTAALDPKDAETFGADLVGMVQRTAESMFGAAAAQFDSRLKALEQQLTGTTRAVAQTAEDVFLGRLKSMVPDYAEQNVDEGFLAWLAEVDPVYGVPRQDGLNAATGALDANRTASVFNAYKATRSPAPAPAAPAAPRQPGHSLERQVAPSVVAQPAASRPEPGFITVASVEKFYADVRRGVYRGRPAEEQRDEAAINKALAEGRVIERPPRHNT